VRRPPVPLALAAVLALAGCGGSATTLDAIWHRSGEQVSMVMGTSDYATGDVRFSFLVVDHRGRPVYRPRATVWLARSRTDAPVQQTTARLEAVGVPGSAEGSDATHIYVARARVPRPGTWWVLARPAGMKIGAVGNLEVRERSFSPAVGARAYPSRTPTIASTGANFAALTTRVPPDRSLLEYSVADSLRAHVPFVLVFATPKFCASRTCGPIVDVTMSVQKREAARGVRFIHVEIYKDNAILKGRNRWVTEWRLPTEPWIFLVARDGRIKAKFEGSVSIDELDAAVRATLVGK